MRASRGGRSKTTEKAVGELARLTEQIGRARAVLARLQQEIVAAEQQRDDTVAPLKANEQQVISTLRAQLDSDAPAQALNDVARSAAHADLQEAIEQLLMAALSAQDSQAGAERAQQQQAGFIAVLAHELRNPMTPIRMAAARLTEVQVDEAKLQRLQGVIERQVVHMARLVNDLLDLSRVNTGKLRLEFSTVELASIVDDVVDACRPAMERRAQGFELQMAASTIALRCDPVRLAQVLGNLLDNASKYTPDSGQIRMMVAVVDGAVEMTVTDTGIGITADTLPHVFEPFVQDAHATAFNTVGLGIGLTLVRELVEAHGGTVAVASAGHGRGSQFVVKLPLADPAGS